MKNFLGRAVLAFIITFAMTQKLWAKEQKITSSTPIILGEMLTINSQALGEERELQIYLPPGYEHKLKRYPVIYTFDGDFLFQTVSTISAHRAGRDFMPESIVVGIPNNTGKRLDMALAARRSADPDAPIPFGGKTDEYIAFLRDEVIPLIDEKYRTHAHRTLIGMSPTIGPVFQSFWQTPDLFQGHIALAADVGFYLRGNETFADKIVAATHKKNRPKTWLYIGRAGTDVAHQPQIGAGFAGLKARLDEIESPTAHVMVDIVEGEEHYGMALPALSRAFTHMYPVEKWQPDYRAIRATDNPAATIKTFYDQLSADYGFAIAPVASGYWMGMTLAGTGRALTRQKAFDKAIAVYQLGLDYYPNSIGLNYGLANTFEAAEQLGAAIETAKRTVTLAIEQNDADLSEYQDRLNELQEKE